MTVWEDMRDADNPIGKLTVLTTCLAVFTLPEISGLWRSRGWPVVPPSFAFVVAWYWLCVVSVHVPEPYLDEVFHIPQAQKYCDGKWLEWDDKITTPPGLYGTSVLALQPWKLACSAFNLRSVNVWCIAFVALAAGLCRSQIELNKSGPSRTRGPHGYQTQTALNVALFPVLFFFSALYYTDVMSTLAVLAAYSNHLLRVSRPRSSVASDVWTLALGILALTMRQTNVFWVVVYMGGLEAVHAVKSVASKLPKHRITDSVKTAVWRFKVNSSLGDIHDPPFSKVWPDDLLFTVASVAVAVLYNPLRVLKQVWPHITTMLTFTGFVAWNGGVVLGDKSNHVATLHLAQMLYIWPLFAFFSAPLLLPTAFSIAGGMFALLRRLFSRPAQGYPIAHATGALRSEEPVSKRVKHNHVDFSRSAPVAQTHGAASQYTLAGAPLWRVLILLGLLPVAAGVALAVVKYNTIIHPFTLADNRHYMFYVFRYTIRLPGNFRLYLVVPYLLCAGLVLGALTLGDRTPSATSFFNHPFLQPPAVKEPRTVAGSYDGKARRRGKGTQAAIPSQVPNAPNGDTDQAPPSAHTPPLTNVLLLFLATSLSLITAPLVEPRYFIIPWIMWRLHVPAWSTNDLPPALWRVPVVRQVLRLGRVLDLRLLLELAWFCAINYGTMRLFITKPFQWVAEDGTLLDGGRLQRFMW